MKKFLQYIIYLLLAGITYLFAILPFSILYFISDVIYFFIYYVVQYRKKVVRRNLVKSFPEKTDKEIKKIERNFYRHLSDVMIETLKGFTMSKKQIIKRYKFIHNHCSQEVIKSDKSYILVTSHQNNWEWGNMVGSCFTQKKHMVLYKPLSNPYIDKFINKKRTTKNNELIPIALAKRGFEKRKEKNYMYVMVADQRPAKLKRGLWIEFLHQDTVCITGPDILAKIYDLPVVYLDSRKVKRGYYELWFREITKLPREAEKGEITKTFMKMLEQTINNEPEHWLWSHKRWKKTRPKDINIEKI